MKAFCSSMFREPVKIGPSFKARVELYGCLQLVTNTDIPIDIFKTIGIVKKKLRSGILGMSRFLPSVGES